MIEESNQSWEQMSRINPIEMQENLVRAVIQQKLSPDIMPIQITLINGIKSMIKTQEQRLDAFQKESDLSLPDKSFKYALYKLDIDRMSFLLKSYLRARLFKIQKYAFYIIKENILIKLSPQEQQFVVGYAKLRYETYDQNILKDLHKDFKGLGGVEAYFDNSNVAIKKQTPSKQSQVNIDKPNKQSYAFFKIGQNPNELRYQLDIEVNNLLPQERNIISKDDIILMPYALGLPFLQKNEATLL